MNSEVFGTDNLKLSIWEFATCVICSCSSACDGNPLDDAMTAEETIKIIEEAWKDVLYPGDENIYDPEDFDSKRVLPSFAGTTWRGHNVIELRANSCYFSYFEPKAYHYWMPAFLMAAVEDPEEADVILEYIPRSLLKRSREADERWSYFTAAQREAVAAYLRYQIQQFPHDNDAESKALVWIEEGLKMKSGR